MTGIEFKGKVGFRSLIGFDMINHPCMEIFIKKWQKRFCQH